MVDRSVAVLYALICLYPSNRLLVDVGVLAFATGFANRHKWTFGW